MLQNIKVKIHLTFNNTALDTWCGPAFRLQDGVYCTYSIFPDIEEDSREQPVSCERVQAFVHRWIIPDNTMSLLAVPVVTVSGQIATMQTRSGMNHCRFFPSQ